MTLNNLHNTQISGFGYELIRNELLTDLIGKQLPDILYWGGKNLARKHPLETLESIQDFFIQAGWGNLHLVKEKKNEMELELTGELIEYRYNNTQDFTYQLEAGFISQQIQQQKNLLTEAFEQQKKSSKKVIFTIKWDTSDLIE